MDLTSFLRNSEQRFTISAPMVDDDYRSWLFIFEAEMCIHRKTVFYGGRFDCG
jgi:hypothetical protein